MSGRSVNPTTPLLGRLRSPKRPTSTSRTHPRQQLTTAPPEKAEGETKARGQTGHRTQDPRPTSHAPHRLRHAARLNSDIDIPSEGKDNTDEDETDGDDEGKADDINQLIEMQQEILRLLHENAAEKVQLTSMFYDVLDKLNEYQ